VRNRISKNEHWIFLGAIALYLGLALFVVGVISMRNPPSSISVVAMDDAPWISQDAALILETPSLVGSGEVK
jgi:hypothetical protein